MLYCFIKELLDIVNKDDVYWIQYQYALRIKKCIIFSVKKNSFKNNEGNNIISITDRIFWVGDCTYTIIMDKMTDEYSLNSVDTKQTREMIQNWPLLGITKRKIFITEKKEVRHFVDKYQRVFVKTKTKGQSAIICQSNKNIIDSWDFSGEYIISEFQEIAEDLIGKIEVRFIIIDNKVLNASRYIHSIYHKIESGFFDAAEAVKNKLNKIEGFPRSYILDMAAFIDSSGEKYYDIVELNSLSTGLCYINNSIFVDVIPEIRSIYNKTNWGLEFCYDYCCGENEYFFTTDNPSEFLYKRDGVS